VSGYGGGRERHCRTRFVFGQRLLYACTIKIALPRGRAPDGNSCPFTPFHSLDAASCVHPYLTTYLYLSTCLLARHHIRVRTKNPFISGRTKRYDGSIYNYIHDTHLYILLYNKCTYVGVHRCMHLLYHVIPIGYRVTIHAFALCGQTRLRWHGFFINRLRDTLIIIFAPTNQRAGDFHRYYIR